MGILDTSPFTCPLCGAEQETTDHTRWSSMKKLNKDRRTEALNLLATCKHCGFHHEGLFRDDGDSLGERTDELRGSKQSRGFSQRGN